ncbi:MAG TPA: YidB family protein [Ramlibacter sp.]|uniref:YidB family protein n=1 Tax=Ramlibacter sp. TaxID=1917967 RepID=UPI002ED21486
MMNPMLGQVLGGLFGQAMGRRGMRTGGMGSGMGGLGGALGGAVLGGMLGGRRGPAGVPAGRGMGSNRTALMLMLLPMAMRWVQRNGGMGAVLDRFRQKGYGSQMQSWVSTGDNQPLDERAVEQVVGQQDLQEMAQRLGVPEEEVRQAFAEVMPEMVNQLTPDGRLEAQADDVLDEGRQALEKEIEDAQQREASPH